MPNVIQLVFDRLFRGNNLPASAAIDAPSSLNASTRIGDTSAVREELRYFHIITPEGDSLVAHYSASDAKALFFESVKGEVYGTADYQRSYSLHSVGVMPATADHLQECSTLGILPAQMPAKPQILSAVLSPGERFNFADEGPGVRRITLEDRLRDRFASDLTKAALALNSSPTVWTPLKNDVSGLTFSAQGSKFGVFDGARLLFSDVNPRAVIDVAAGFKRSRIAEQFELSQANRTTHRLAV